GRSPARLYLKQRGGGPGARLLQSRSDPVIEIGVCDLRGRSVVSASPAGRRRQVFLEGRAAGLSPGRAVRGNATGRLCRDAGRRTAGFRRLSSLAGKIADAPAPIDGASAAT